MLTDYQKVVEQSEKEKRKRKSRLHGDIRLRKEAKLVGNKVDPHIESARAKIVKLISSDNACHLMSALPSQNFFNVNDIKYEGKSPPNKNNPQKQWRISHLSVNSHFKKKQFRHRSQEPSSKKMSSLIIEKDNTILLERLSLFRKEI